PTLTKVIDRMEEAGLVTRTVQKSDRRRIEVRITPAGTAAVVDLLPAAKRHETQLLASYSPAEVALLKSVLRTLIDRLSAD
ncbi:MarR family transcriptional regulator, partial [Acinetobacter baumannii]